MKKSAFARLFRRKTKPRVVSAPEGYDLWAPEYDTQPNNAVLELDSHLFEALLSQVSLRNKTILDVGCGTGRHWRRISAEHPAKLIGVDPSRNMLEALRRRYPSAASICGSGAFLPIADECFDAVVSTLALAHIQDAATAITDWYRVLRPGGHVLLTDFHPSAALAGLKRTFESSGKVIEIEQRTTDLPELRKIASECGFSVALVLEENVGASVRFLFEAANAIEHYDRLEGLPLVFAMNLVKNSNRADRVSTSWPVPKISRGRRSGLRAAS